MAKGDGITLEKLYLELGLDMSQLQADILAADETITKNLGRLNRQQNTIKLRVEADVASLDRVKDAAQILEIQERGLNQQLTLSRDKLAILEAAYRQVANNQNSSAMAVQRAEQAWQKQRLEVGKLEQALKNLSAQKISFDTSQLQDGISKINAKIQNVRIKAEIDTSRLQSAGQAFDAQKVRVTALTQELELQRQKLAQLQAQMYQSAQHNGANSTTTLNIKSNVLRQIQEINQLQAKLREVQNTNINVQVRADSLRRVEAEVTEKISLLNSKLEHIRVKTDIDVSKLGSAASEFDRAKAHVQGLNLELDLQNQKLAHMRQALATSVSANGLNNVKTINLQTEIQKQIQAIDQLKAKINELNKIQPPKTNGLLSGYLNIKGDVTGKLNSITSAFANLKGATSSADSAVTSVLTVIDAIPHPVGRAVAALTGLPLIFKGIENSIIEMTRAAAVSGDAVYVMSRGMQMSIKDAGKFSTNAKVAGTDVNSLRVAVQGVQRQIVKGGDDSRAAEWLKRYGESARDASGNLKNLNDMTISLSRAYQKAKAEGKNSEFVFSVFRNISPDDITAIEDWIAVNEQASKIVKNGLANPALAHEVKGNLNMLAVQEGHLKASFESALLPATNEIVPRLIERTGKLTKVLADNKDMVIAIGTSFASIIGVIESGIDKVSEFTSISGKLWRENHAVRKTSTDDVVKKYIDDPTIQNAKDIVEREIETGGYSDEDIKLIRSRNQILHEETEKAAVDAKKLFEARRKALAEANQPILDKFKYDESIQSGTDLLKKLTDAEKEAIEKTPSAFGSLQERAAYLNQELQKLRAEAQQAAAEVKNFNSVAQDLSTAGLERQKLGDDEELINDLRLARKYEENAAAIRDKLSLNDYDYQKSNLQRWLQEQLPRDAEQSMAKYNAVMKEFAARDAQIEQERADKLKQIRDSVAEADKTALKSKLDNIDKERQAWLKAGMEEAEAAQLAEQKKLRARQEAAEKANQYIKNAADIEFGLTHTAFEKQLRDIERWKEEQIKRAETAEEVAGIVRNAAAKEAEAFEREVDRIKGLTQSLEDEIFEIEHSRYEADVRRAQQKAQKFAEETGDYGTAQRYLNAKMNELNKKAAESRAKNGDYTKSPNGNQVYSAASVHIMTNENRIRAQVSQGLSQQAKDIANATQATRQLTDAQKNLLQQTNQTASGFEIIAGDQVQGSQYTAGLPVGEYTIIAGDQVTQLSREDAARIAQQQNQVSQEYDQLLQRVQRQTQGLPKDLSQKSAATDAQEATTAQKSLAESAKAFSPDYFKQLAEGTEAVSETQLMLTDSTLKLIEAQNKFAAALNSQQPTSARVPNDGVLKLSYPAEDLRDAQLRLADSTRLVDQRLRAVSEIPPNAPTVKKDDGLKLGFDYDTAKDIFLAGVGLAAASASTGAGVALSPEILLGSIPVAALAGLAKGTYDETTAAREQVSDDKLKPYVEADLSKLITPVVNIDGNVQKILTALKPESADVANKPLSAETFAPLANLDAPLTAVIQAVQETHSDERLQELLGALPNIEDYVHGIADATALPRENVDTSAQPAETPIDYLTPLTNIGENVKSILQSVQVQQETPVTFETIVTPLDNISTLVGNILTALNNRQPPQINVSPNISVNLGGAYVFDNAMKKSLVDDCTQQIVDNVETAVRQATNQSSYGYGA